jgi:hypothetical protein
MTKRNLGTSNWMPLVARVSLSTPLRSHQQPNDSQQVTLQYGSSKYVLGHFGALPHMAILNTFGNPTRLHTTDVVG